MKIEEYIDEWDRDSSYYQNGDVATYLTVKHANIIGKWSQYHAAKKRRMKIMEINLEGLKIMLSDYYAGLLNDDPEELSRLKRGPNLSRYLKERIPSKVSSDKAVIEQLVRIAVQQEKIDFISGVKKELEFRPNALKTALEYRRFEGA